MRIGDLRITACLQPLGNPFCDEFRGNPATSRFIPLVPTIAQLPQISSQPSKRELLGFSHPGGESSRLVGIVALEDVRKVNRDAWDSMIVQDIMTPVEKLIVTSPDEDAGQALEKLSTNDVRQLPVLSNGELVGLLRRRDIIKWLQLHAESARN
jgi:CBS domain-containing protein